MDKYQLYHVVTPVANGALDVFSLPVFVSQYAIIDLENSFFIHFSKDLE